jgi:hypothetical protein
MSLDTRHDEPSPSTPAAAPGHSRPLGWAGLGMTAALAAAFPVAFVAAAYPALVAVASLMIGGAVVARA